MAEVYAGVKKVCELTGFAQGIIYRLGRDGDIKKRFGENGELEFGLKSICVFFRKDKLEKDWRSLKARRRQAIRNISEFLKARLDAEKSVESLDLVGAVDQKYPPAEKGGKMPLAHQFDGFEKMIGDVVDREFDKLAMRWLGKKLKRVFWPW